MIPKVKILSWVIKDQTSINVKPHLKSIFPNSPIVEPENMSKEEITGKRKILLSLKGI